MTLLQPSIEFIFQHPDDLRSRDDWFELLEYYNSAMELLRKPTEFMDNEIEEFQSLIDSIL